MIFCNYEIRGILFRRKRIGLINNNVFSDFAKSNMMFTNKTHRLLVKS